MNGQCLSHLAPNGEKGESFRWHEQDAGGSLGYKRNTLKYGAEGADGIFLSPVEGGDTKR